jgi:small subunit ribosomal protein S7
MIKEGSNVPRKGHTQKRDVLADPMYNSKVVTKLVNSIMLDGKKGVAQKIVYGAFATVEEKTGRPALEVFEEAMNNVMPALEVKARRIGGATYQVPIEVRPDRRQAFTSRAGITLFIASSNTSRAGLPVFSSTVANAPYTIF